MYKNRKTRIIRSIRSEAYIQADKGNLYTYREFFKKSAAYLKWQK